MADERYHVRWRGKVEGPYSLEELQMMAVRGQLLKLYEVSTDKSRWVQALEMPQLFPEYVAPVLAPESRLQGAERSPAGSKPEQKRWKDAGASEQEEVAVAGDEAIPPPAETLQEAPLPPLEEIDLGEGLAPEDVMEEDGWYYAVNGEVKGPVPSCEILALIQRSELGADDVVVSPGQGMDWIPIRSVVAFREACAKAPPSALPDPGGPPASLGVGMQEDGGGQASQALHAQEDYSKVALVAFLLAVMGTVVPVSGTAGLALGIYARKAMNNCGNMNGAKLAIGAIVIGLVNTALDPIKFAFVLQRSFGA